MKFYSKNEVFQHIGKPKFFEKKLEIKSCAYFVDQGPEFNGFSQSFSLLIFSKGIVFYGRDNCHIAFRKDDILSYQLNHDSIDGSIISLQSKLAKKILFKIEQNKLNEVLSGLRLFSYPIHRNINNDEHVITENIKELALEFKKPDTELSKKFQLLDTSTFGNLFELELSEENILWKGKSIKPHECRGFSFGITVNSVHGIKVSRDFEILIQVQDSPPFIISFSKKAGVSSLDDDEEVFGEIIEILFNLISRKVVLEWLEEFANNRVVKYNDFSLCRDGIVLHQKSNDFKMFWDEILIYPDQIRWVYNNTIFVKCDSYYDRRPYMLSKLLSWIGSDESRVNKFLGSEANNELEVSYKLQWAVKS